MWRRPVRTPKLSWMFCVALSDRFACIFISTYSILPRLNKATSTQLHLHVTIHSLSLRGKQSSQETLAHTWCSKFTNQDYGSHCASPWIFLKTVSTNYTRYVSASSSCTETVWRWKCETNVLQCRDTVHYSDNTMLIAIFIASLDRENRFFLICGSMKLWLLSILMLFLLWVFFLVKYWKRAGKQSLRENIASYPGRVIAT